MIGPECRASSIRPGHVLDVHTASIRLALGFRRTAESETGCARPASSSIGCRAEVACPARVTVPARQARWQCVRRRMRLAEKLRLGPGCAVRPHGEGKLALASPGRPGRLTAPAALTFTCDDAPAGGDSSCPLDPLTSRKEHGTSRRRTRAVRYRDGTLRRRCADRHGLH